jgi:hypothetical protein
MVSGAGGERSWISAAVSLSMIRIGPPHLGASPKITGTGGGDLGLALWCRTEQLKAKWQSDGTFTMGQESEVSDAHETFGQQMQQEAAQELSGQPTGRHHAMYMRVKFEFLSPAVQHAEEADFSTEMLGIARDFQKGFRTGAKQEIVEDLLVLQDQRGQMTRKREAHAVPRAVLG